MNCVGELGRYTDCLLRVSLGAPLSCSCPHCYKHGGSKGDSRGVSGFSETVFFCSSFVCSLFFLPSFYCQYWYTFPTASFFFIYFFLRLLELRAILAEFDHQQQYRKQRTKYTCDSMNQNRNASAEKPKP